MGYLLRKLAVKAAEKMSKVSPTDNMTQSTVNDIFEIVRDIFL